MIIKDGQAKLSAEEYAQELIRKGEEIKGRLERGQLDQAIRKIEDAQWNLDCLLLAIYEENARGRKCSLQQR